MKTKLALLAVLLSAAFAPPAARAEAEISFEFFYDNLSPYGDWIEVGDYGNCWRPRDVDEDWAPYTDGYWSYTDAGWTWVSYEDFGDITYHYGRWARVNDVGWCWVPDTDWGPAWVSWRKTDDHIGWAPLPPEARWRTSVGISVWSDDYYDIGPSYYNFCPTVDFGAPVIRHVLVPRVRVISLFGGSLNITNITYNSYGRHVFCGGPDYGYVNRYSRRHVPALKLVQNTTIIQNVTIINNQRIVRAQRNVVAGNTLTVVAPKIINKPATGVIRPPTITKVVGKPQFDKGWAGVKDPVEQRKMREKMRADTKGLTPDTAPAKPVQVTDLKPVPEKADPKAPSPVQVAPRPGKPGKDRPVAVQPPEPQPGVTPVQPGKGKPGAKPAQPPIMPAEKPGKVAVDQPDRPTPLPPADKPAKVGKPVTKTGKPVRPEFTPMPERPPTADVPARQPFRENVKPVAPVPMPVAPVAPVKKGKPGPDNDAIARQQQEAERQRAAAQARPKVEAPRPKPPQPDASAAQRQAASQRAAEAQQRALQMQRQQRPPQVQPKPQVQPRPQVVQPKPQPRPQLPPQPRPQVQPKPQIQPRPQPMPPAKVSPGGGQLTPEQIEAMKQKRGK